MSVGEWEYKQLLSQSKHPICLRPSFRKFKIVNICRSIKWLVLYLYFLIQHLCICVRKLNLLMNVVTMRRRKARKIQIWIAIKYATDNMYVFSYSSCLYPVHCTINILIRILSICLSFPLHQHHQDFNSLYLSVFVSFRMLLRLCLITSSSSTHILKFFCICLQFLFIFPVVVSIIITIYISIWTHCVFSQFLYFLHPYHHCHFSNVCCNCCWI